MINKPGQNSGMTSAHAEPPTIAVIRGNPSPEEIAALVGAILITAPVDGDTAAPPRSQWWASGLPARRRDWRVSGLPA